MITTSLQNIRQKQPAKTFNWLNIVLATMALSVSLCSSAAQLYRYKDDNVLNQMIPPKYVSKGYDVLNDKGRLIRKVAPALTAQQILVRDTALEQERLIEIERQKQEVKDNELTQLYSHPNDAVRVLSRRIQDILGVIQVKHSNIDTTRNTILEEESKAANRQRKGLSIDQATLVKLDKLKSDILNSQQDILELKDELEKVGVDFDIKIRRLEVVTGKKATDYENIPKPDASSSSDLSANTDKTKVDTH